MKHNLPLTLILALVPIACSGGSIAGGDAGKASHKSAAGDDDEDDETDVADKPQEVSGAFLVCGPDPTTTPGEDQGAYGCVFTGKEGAKLAGTLASPAIEIAKTNGVTVTPAATTSAEGSQWHAQFLGGKLLADNMTSLRLSGTLAGKAVVGKTDNLKGIPSQWNPFDATATEPAAAAPGHWVFVTSRTYEPGADDDSHFASATAADAKCQAHAQSAGLVPAKGATWRAIVAGGGKGPKDRVTLTGDVKTLDGKVVATAAAFWGAHQAPIALDESGANATGDEWVWTGAAANGEAALTCNDWRDGDPAMFGSPSRGWQGSTTDTANWLHQRESDCGRWEAGQGDEAFRLFCISQ